MIVKNIKLDFTLTYPIETRDFYVYFFTSNICMFKFFKKIDRILYMFKHMP